ncbi:hypothetical protein D3C73_904300 [compost metagenome]
MLLRVRQGRAGRRQGRDVGGEGVAFLSRIGLPRLALGRHHDGSIFDAPATEIVLDVQFGGRARLHADARAVQFGRAAQIERAPYHEALAVIIVDPGEAELRPRIPAHGPGGVAPQHVHPPVPQGVEALLGRQRHEAHGVRIAEDSRRRRSAEVDVETPPGASVVRIGEADQSLVHAAVQTPALTHGRESGTGLRLAGGDRRLAGRFARLGRLRLSRPLTGSCRQERRHARRRRSASPFPHPFRRSVLHP